MLDSKLSKVTSYLSFLKQCLNLEVTIKDKVGFLAYADKEISASLLPYILHTNPYCQHIKFQNNLEKKCSSMGDYIYGKCIKQKTTFLGVCHAGVCEYIVPLKTSVGEPFGFLTVGCFQAKTGITEKNIRRLSKASSWDLDTATSFYKCLRGDIPFDCEAISSALGLVVDYLSEIYLQCKPKISNSKNFIYCSNEDVTLSRLISYISENYTKQLSILDLAAYCNCSQSHVSHIFKKRTGMTIKSYVNWLRINQSKKLLMNENKTIVAIAYELGFEDSNYFSKVFSVQIGMSPTKYRNLLLLGEYPIA